MVDSQDSVVGRMQRLVRACREREQKAVRVSVEDLSRLVAIAGGAMEREDMVRTMERIERKIDELGASYMPPA